MGVKATLVEDTDAEGVDIAPGSFEFYSYKGRPKAGMIYICPCGCGARGALAFRPADGERSSWEWDGNETAPTLSPSVHHVGHWHGYLKAGIWEPC